MNIARNAALAFVLSCFAVVAPSVSLAQGAPTAQKPSIISTDANFQTNQITIAGSNFGTPEPCVTLDGHASPKDFSTELLRNLDRVVRCGNLTSQVAHHQPHQVSARFYIEGRL
jgi:hypothetical protein